MDWNKLVEDLVTSKALAEKAAKGDDGGSCNLDTVYIRIPRVKEERVIAEFTKAGLRCYKSEFFGRPCYNIGGLAGGQANSNTRAVIAVYQYLDSQGWDVGIQYILD